jgi:heme-degrading monooxygenase HmoA
MAVVKINAIEVPEGAGPELERRFANRLHAVDNQPGFISFELLRPVAGETRYFVLTHWEDEESFQAWRNGPAAAAHAGERGRPVGAGHGHGQGPVATGATLLEFEVVQSSHAAKPTG